MTGTSPARCNVVTQILATVSIILSVCAVGAVPVFSQTAQPYENYLSDKDSKTGQEVAVSLPDAPVNFMIVGDLNQYSFNTVFEFFVLLSNATAIRIDSGKKEYILYVVHDRQVFARLKSNKAFFTSLGIPDHIVDVLTQRMKEGTKCLVETFPTSTRDDLAATVVLLSERYEDYLAPAVFRAFGVVTKAPTLYALLSACVLYEGRRAGLRELRKLQSSGRRLAQQCLEKTEK